MASEAGGMDIEEVAAKTPEKIVKVAVDPAIGLLPFHVRKLCYGLNITDDYINIVFESIPHHQIPSHEKETELVKRTKEGDSAAREELITAHMRLVENVAGKYLAHGHAMAELVGIGKQGLAKAIENYDHTKGYRFSTLAVWWIRQSLIHFLAEKGRSVHKELTGKIGRIISGFYKMFTECDCSLAEINPLAITADGETFALDAKINLDDNALYRHKDFAELRDIAEEQPLEVEASKHNLSYIKLDGAVGCMVNGAGLAMATMDIIKLHGQMPANFLDVGGAASSERVANAFRILTSDKNVKAVLINIFGGIVRCDRVANGIVEALKEVEVNVPIVVRLEGTNAEEAREILNKSALKFTVAGTLDDAARKAVAAIN
jgi:RNA polymerase sigma factor (sigma-70 family)